MPAFRVGGLLVAASLSLVSACGESVGSGPEEDPSSGGAGAAASGGSDPGQQVGGAGGSIEGSGGADASGGSEASSGGGEASGGGPGGSCSSVAESEPHFPASARSFGFSGTDAEYGELYDALCATHADCIAPCTARGGTEEFCDDMVCIESTEDYCLPPTKWRRLDGLLTEGETTETSLSLANGPDHDLLIAEDFGFDIPSEAQILGVSVTVRRSAGFQDEAADQQMRLLRGGTVGGANRAISDAWTTSPLDVTYGGPLDLWGSSFTPAEINASDFGVALSVLPLLGAGRAYIESIAVTVHYGFDCE